MKVLFKALLWCLSIVLNLNKLNSALKSTLNINNGNRQKLGILTCYHF